VFQRKQPHDSLPLNYKFHRVEFPESIVEVSRIGHVTIMQDKISVFLHEDLGTDGQFDPVLNKEVLLLIRVRYILF
jgi:hypothetical protein